MSRLPQLDGLRGLAVALVVLSHAGGPQWDVFGAYGVTLFFVLSAYLITGILLRERGRALVPTFGAFYARRALRIFPAYYLVLAALLLADVPGVRATWLWHASYATNWLIASTGVWPPGVAHLWTLAIEEQFYVVWPMLALLVPSRSFGRACIGFIALAIVSRGLLASATGAPQSVVTPTFTTLDAFGIGALLAWRQHVAPMEKRSRLLNWACWIGVVLVLNAVVMRSVAHGHIFILATERLGAALIAAWLIAAAASGALWRAFEWRPIRFVGTISYGIYLWHLPIIWAITRFAQGDPTAMEASKGGPAMLALVSALTLSMACLSWYAVEEPMNRLKRLIPYRRRSSASIHALERPAVTGIS